MRILFLLWIFNSEFQNGFIFSQTVLTRDQKLSNLLSKLSDDAFTSSSYKESFNPYRAKRIRDTISKNSQRYAWCPKYQITKYSTEYIQVELGDLKILSSLISYGLDHGNDGFFVSSFYLHYQRENSSNWHLYKDEDQKHRMRGNVDSRNAGVLQFRSNIVAKRIKITPVSDVPNYICMKFSLYGYDFNDGVIEYSIPQGDIFRDSMNNEIELFDKTYDSPSISSPIDQSIWKEGTQLRGGMGQLMDNIIDVEFFPQSNEKKYFVGWQNRENNRTIELVFRLDRIRIIKCVRFHILNNIKQDISVFSTATFEFSIGGKIYNVYSKNFTYHHRTDSKLMTARWVNITLDNPIAKFVKITLEFRLKWIIMTEVFIDTVLHNKSVPIEQTESMGNIISKESDRKSETNTDKINYLLVSLCVTISFFGLLCFISICFLRFRRHRKRRIKEKPSHLTRYGNMTCNNIIPISAVPTSNGGLYKPIPNGVYDCMPGFQSQTLNIRKAHNYSNQQLFGTYSNRKNSSPTTNSVLPSINQEGYCATLSQIVGQQNMSLLCPENKRASFDGSYGTSSNPEYSNASLDKKTLPVHLVPFTSTVYEQYKINPNNQHNLASSPHQFNLISPVLSGFNQDSHQPFIDSFTMNNIVPPVITNYGQGYIFSPPNISFDSSIIRWPDELFDIVEKHSRYDVLLQSPIGGSMIMKEKFDNNELSAAKDYEKEIVMKLPQIDLSKIELKKQIGSGRFGSIHKGIFNGIIVIMKAINKDCPFSVRTQYLKIISDLLKISSVNVSNCIGYCQYSVTDIMEEFSNQDLLTKSSINYIVMQHTHHGYLHKFIRRHSRPVSSAMTNSFNNKTNSDTSCTSLEDDPVDCNFKPVISQSCLIYIAAQISDGMSFLEQEDLIHRDLATRNCLVGPRLSILITDTALNNVKFQKDYVPITNILQDLSLIGIEINKNSNYNQSALFLPLQWMSWEAVLMARYSSKSDVWSFGVLLWDLLTYCKHRPFFCVPQHLTCLDPASNYLKCVSLLYNFKCLEQGFDNALLPNNESLSQVRKGSSWTSPLPLPIPSQFVPVSTDRRGTTMPTPRMIHKDSSMNNILDSNREIRDLIASCWSIVPANRPKFKDINIFLRQKINNFNVEEEYQLIQTNFRKS